MRFVVKCAILLPLRLFRRKNARIDTLLCVMTFGQDKGDKAMAMDISRLAAALPTMDKQNETVTKQQIAAFLEGASLADMEATYMRVQELMAYYRCAILEVETKFRVLNEQFSLQHERNPIEGIKSRLKSWDSILEKMHRKNLPLSVESIEKELFDVAGVRVVCSFIDDIYMLADCLMTQDDVTLITKKDYIQNPKQNGYRSLHLIVEVPIFLQSEKRLMKVEVQLRTIAMDFWASLEHKLRYKKDIDESVAVRAMAELSECAEMSAFLDRKMQEVRDCIEK